MSTSGCVQVFSLYHTMLSSLSDSMIRTLYVWVMMSISLEVLMFPKWVLDLVLVLVGCLHGAFLTTNTHACRGISVSNQY